MRTLLTLLVVGVVSAFVGILTSRLLLPITGNPFGLEAGRVGLIVSAISVAVLVALLGRSARGKFLK